MIAVCRSLGSLSLVFIAVALCSPSSANTLDKETLRWMRDKPRIDSIVVEGNQYFSSGTITKRMYSRKYTLWSALKGDRRARIQRETLGRDTLEIKFLYVTNGFLGVRVTERLEQLADGKAAMVRVNIDEGTRYQYGAMHFQGDFPPGFAFGFEKTTRNLKLGKPINLFDVRSAAFNVKTILANDGYPYATVDYVIDSVGGRAAADITFEVYSDSFVHFGEVAIEGYGEYPVYAALRELKITEGDIYRRKTILDSQRRLFESGYYSTLQLRQADNIADRLRPDFVLRLRERKPKYVTIKTGAGQSEYKDLIWDFSAGFGKRNFLGTRRYDLLADYSLGHDLRLITHRYRLRFTEPWFLGIRMPLAFTGQFEPGIKDPVQDYRIETWSLSLSTVKLFGIKVRTKLGLEYESVRIFGVADELKAIIREDNRISVRRNIYFSFYRDSRDNIFIPRRGSASEIRAKYYGGFLGGDDNFTGLEASWSRYEVFWPGWVSATRFMGGWTEAFGSSTEVPINDLLYLGGANSVRAFRENSLGPLSVDGQPIGANLTFVFNQEFRWKTLQLFKVIPIFSYFFGTFPLWQSVFVDVGNGFRDPSEFRFKDMAVAYGTGFQIVTPAGPIRIDYARRVKSNKIDFADRWHFTILYAF